MRDQGIAIVGSGMSFHDLRHFRDGDTTASAAFDAWLDETAKAPEAEREARLTQWDKAPSARECHPREEHLLPLMVVAGAAGDERGHARLQRQDRRQDDLGVSVRVGRGLQAACRLRMLAKGELFASEGRLHAENRLKDWAAPSYAFLLAN